MVKIKGKITVSDTEMWGKFKNVLMRPITDSDKYTKLELMLKKIAAKMKKKKKKKGGRRTKKRKSRRKKKRTRRRRRKKR